MKDNSLRYRASKHDCGSCPLKPRCCPNAPARKVPRSIYEGARDLAREIAKTETYQTSRYQRKKVEMLFAHLKRILKLDQLSCGAVRCPRRIPPRCNRPEPPQAGQAHPRNTADPRHLREEHRSRVLPTRVRRHLR